MDTQMCSETLDHFEQPSLYSQMKYISFLHFFGATIAFSAYLNRCSNLSRAFYNFRMTA